MPRGDKSKYKQKCKADHIAGSYESRGVAQAESEADGVIEGHTKFSRMPL